MKHSFAMVRLLSLAAVLLATTHALAQPSSNARSKLVLQPATKRVGIAGLSKYNSALSRILSRSADVRSPQRALATATNSNGKAELLVGVAADRAATAKGSAHNEFASGVACQSRPFQLDFTTVGSFEVFKMDATKIFPGAIVTPESVLNSGFANVANLPARKPIHLSLDLLTPEGQADSVVVEGPIHSASINGARSTLVNAHQGAAIPPQAAATAESFSASAEVAAEILSSAGGLVPLEEFGIPANVSLERSISGSITAAGAIERYSVSLFEPMYVMSVAESGADLFVDPAAAAKANGVMVNSVIYGRVLFLYIEGVGGSTKLKALFKQKIGLDLALEQGPVNIGVDQNVNASANADFKVTHMKATVIGGDSTEARALMASILTGEDARQRLRDYVAARSSAVLSAATAARPIGFTLVNVKDNASMGVRFTTDTDILFNCQQAKKLRVELVSVKAPRVVDNALGAGGDNDDLFGDITASVESADVLSGSRSKKLFHYSQSAPLRLKQGQSESIQAVLETTLDPNDLGAFSVKFSESVQDDLDPAERLVAGNKSSLAYVFVGQTDRFDAADLDLLRRGSATRVLKLQESGGESSLEATVKFSLVD